MEVTIQTLAANPTGTIEAIVNVLGYGCYKHNRDEGMTHEQLISIGVGNDACRAKYDKEKLS